MSNRIFLDAPDIGESEKRYLSRAIDTGYISTTGPYVPKFERKIAEYLGVKNAVSTQSGTAAIHMALHELGIGKGDEVIVPALTFIATVNPVMYVGAKPVLVDVDAKTWNIDPDEIEKAITRQTKAIIPVHFYGNPCDMDRIMKIAKKYSIYVVEDATESLGARYKGRYTGSFGNLGCLSFNGNKTLTTGGGGMIVSNDGDKIEHIKFLVNQARDDSTGYYHSELGFNYRMTNIEAALGLAQMERLNGFLKKKRKINQIYKEELKKLKCITFQKETSSGESSAWLSCVIFDESINILELQKNLKSNNIPVRRIFMPITEMPPYKRFKTSDYKNAYELFEHGLCLPSSTLNREENIFRVCKILKKLI